MPASARERLIDAAAKVFHREGFRGTGIERVIQGAGVSRMTLYNHFKSKDDLIVAALRRTDERFRHHLAREVEKRTQDPRERLLVVFDVTHEWINSPDYSGCIFVNVAGEFPDEECAIRRSAAEHKRMAIESLEALAHDAGARDPHALAVGLHLLLEGLTVSAQVSGAAHEEWTARAKYAAELLIDEQLKD